ncbi:hypothetical protein [uncultured Amphritea sp.]|uniref:hypothetical protein n=1 Tax=uncultured Amphritea sp. TaxID=981605 RepID=UPI00261A0835|nr:hypothetical protein [uncultured Amphritea sp.]
MNTTGPNFGPERVFDTAYRGGKKLVFEFFKNLTILSTVSILIIVSFMEKIFESPTHHGLVIWAVFLLALTVLCSLFPMKGLAGLVEASGTINSNLVSVVGLIAIFSFAIAFVLMGVFFSLNFNIPVQSG